MSIAFSSLEASTHSLHILIPLGRSRCHTISIECFLCNKFAKSCRRAVHKHVFMFRLVVSFDFYCAYVSLDKLVLNCVRCLINVFMCCDALIVCCVVIFGCDIV